MMSIEAENQRRRDDYDDYVAYVRQLDRATFEGVMTEAEIRYERALQAVVKCVKRWFPVSVPLARDITIGEADDFRIAYAEMERCEAAVREERKPKPRWREHNVFGIMDRVAGKVWVCQEATREYRATVVAALNESLTR